MIYKTDRRTIDVIISKFFHLCFKMAQSFESLDTILSGWAKDKEQKKFQSRHRTGTRNRNKKDRAISYFRK